MLKKREKTKKEKIAILGFHLVFRFEEANKSFSAAVQVQDGQVKAWALWGDYLDQLFAKDRNLTLGVAALTCFLHACRQQHEAKSHKYLARTIWMLTYDDEEVTMKTASAKTIKIGNKQSI